MHQPSYQTQRFYRYRESLSDTQRCLVYLRYLLCIVATRSCCQATLNAMYDIGHITVLDANSASWSPCHRMARDTIPALRHERRRMQKKTRARYVPYRSPNASQVTTGTSKLRGFSVWFDTASKLQQAPSHEARQRLRVQRNFATEASLWHPMSEKLDYRL